MYKDYYSLIIVCFSLRAGSRPRTRTCCSSGCSGLGLSSDDVERLGGRNPVVPACAQDCMGTVGRNDGDCAPPFTLAEGVEGSGNIIGPSVFFEDYTCQVILIHIGAEW